MIANSKYKFLFLKTSKTGGTSLEIALSSHCGVGDIITPIVEEDEKLRQALGFRGPQNFLHKQNSKKPIFWNHIPAYQIKKTITPESWEGLYKFSVVRNPFARAVSGYFWKGGPQKYDTFYRFLQDNSDYIRLNWKIISIDNAPVLDGVVRYETLAEDLGRISHEIRLPGNIHEIMKGIRAKGKYRDKTKPPIDYFLECEKSRRLVELLCEEEIEHFGYQFEAWQRRASKTPGDTAGEPTGAGRQS